MFFMYASNYDKRRERGTGQVCTMHPHVTEESLDRYPTL
jgi:hypothetical protein